VNAPTAHRDASPEGKESEAFCTYCFDAAHWDPCPDCGCVVPWQAKVSPVWTLGALGLLLALAVGASFLPGEPALDVHGWFWVAMCALPTFIHVRRWRKGTYEALRRARHRGH
jgi:hypothetical protein